MKTSRIVTFAAVVAVTASLIGAFISLPQHTNDVVNAPETAAPVSTATLDPIVVSASR